jgi:hypothetical protein
MGWSCDAEALDNHLMAFRIGESRAAAADGVPDGSSSRTSCDVEPDRAR